MSGIELPLGIVGAVGGVDLCLKYGPILANMVKEIRADDELKMAGMERGSRSFARPLKAPLRRSQSAYCGSKPSG